MSFAVPSSQRLSNSSLLSLIRPISLTACLPASRLSIGSTGGMLRQPLSRFTARRQFPCAILIARFALNSLILPPIPRAGAGMLASTGEQSTELNGSSQKMDPPGDLIIHTRQVHPQRFRDGAMTQVAVSQLGAAVGSANSLKLSRKSLTISSDFSPRFQTEARRDLFASRWSGW